MSILAQKAYEKYFGGIPCPSPREWFECPEESGKQAKNEHVYGRKLKSIQAAWLSVKELKIESAAQGKGYSVWQQKLLEARKNVIVKEPHSLAAQFRELATKWKEDIKLTSSLTEIVLNTSYQRIIGLGPAVIPLVLQDLQDNGGHWFWALEALSGENPVNDENAGRVKKMTQAWLEWGKENGFI